MTIGAAQIAAGQKYRAGDLTGIIQQRQLLQSANTHGDTPPFPDAGWCGTISILNIVVNVNTNILYIVFSKTVCKKAVDSPSDYQQPFAVWLDSDTFALFFEISVL